MTFLKAHYDSNQLVLDEGAALKPEQKGFFLFDDGAVPEKRQSLLDVLKAEHPTLTEAQQKAKMRNNTEITTAKDATTPVEDMAAEVTTDADLPLLDRNTYKSIKKMDRASLEALIQDIHESGRRKGLKEAAGDDHTGEPEINLDLRELEKQIKAVKGVGEKRAEEIMQIVEHWLGVE